MTDKPDKPKVSRLELRKEFPHIPFSEFNLIIDTLGLDEPDALRIILAEEEDMARAKVAEEQHRLRERFDAITASMLHRQLTLPLLPKDIDLEHVRAYLVYGFVAPSSNRRFAGENYLPQQHIRSNVKNKLGLRFDADKYSRAENFLLRNGVLGGKGGVAGLVAYSLNVNENAKGLTRIGKEIVIATKRFMHEHRPVKNSK